MAVFKDVYPLLDGEVTKLKAFCTDLVRGKHRVPSRETHKVPWIPKRLFAEHDERWCGFDRLVIQRSAKALSIMPPQNRERDGGKRFL